MFPLVHIITGYFAIGANVEILDYKDMEERVIEFGLTYQFGDLTWDVSKKFVVYKKGS